MTPPIAGRAAVVHELKCDPAHFVAVFDGSKPYEVRRDDRRDGFAVGDRLRLREFIVPPAAYLYGTDAQRERYGFRAFGFTGRECVRVVTHILRDFPGLAPGYVALGLSDPDGSLTEHRRELARVRAQLDDALGRLRSLDAGPLVR